jgi:hypothetical protein
MEEAEKLRSSQRHSVQARQALQPNASQYWTRVYQMRERVCCSAPHSSIYPYYWARMGVVETAGIAATVARENGQF